MRVDWQLLCVGRSNLQGKYQCGVLVVPHTYQMCFANTLVTYKQTVKFVGVDS